jgi:hypothetical protein
MKLFTEITGILVSCITEISAAWKLVPLGLFTGAGFYYFETEPGV